MLTDEEFDSYARELCLNDIARVVLARVRGTEPERRVRNVAGNLCGSFPSEKMGRGIQWESWFGERPLVLLWEWDSDCLEMWDQPRLSLKISYQLPSGKKSGSRTTIDFILLKRRWAGGVDYKSSEELVQLSVEQPYRWVQTGLQSWDQPPAREALQKLGLGYRVFSEKDIPHVLVRNVDFLRSRLIRPVSIPAEARVPLQARLQDEPRLLLVDAIATAGDADILYSGHFQGYWYLDLRHDPLALPDNAWVYRNSLAYHAYEALTHTRVPLLLKVDPNTIPERSWLDWKGQGYELVRRTDERVFLQVPGQPLLDLKKGDFRRLLEAGEISSRTTPVSTAEGLNVLSHATKKSIKDALSKLAVIEQVRSGDKRVANLGIPKRTFYDWKAKFAEGEMRYGSGYIGLITRDALKGNRSARTDDAELELMKKAFDWLREKVPRDVKAGWNYYVSLCGDTVAPRSFNSFDSAWHALPEHETTKDREGKRAAYPSKSPRMSGGDHLAQGPPEGDSPFQRVHIDHKQSDVFCRRMNSTLPLGKPWISIAIDAFTRLVLGLWISILAPSHASVMMVLRDIIRRHGKLPLTVFTDSGKDMHATRVEQFMASYVCERADRPAGEPRFGNPVERLNLDIDHHLGTVLHGSNEVLKTPRMSSASHDPRALSYLTIPPFADKVEEVLFEKYPDKHHGGLGCTPNEKLHSAALLQGRSWGRPVAFDELTIFRTLVRPHKHGGLIRQRDGIRLNQHNYFEPGLIAREHDKLEDVPFWDPEDPTYIQARIGGAWKRCALIDSQMRRLPPEGQRRYYLGERIYLAKPSTHKSGDLEFARSMGDMYQEADAEREAILAADAASSPKDVDAPPDPGSSANPDADRPSSSAESAAAPISWRGRT